MRICGGTPQPLSSRDACAPFDQPALRDALVKLRQLNEQTVDKVTIDRVISRQFDAAAKEKAESLVRSFRDYIEQHRAEIEALQILYSRPFKQRLTEEGLKELEAKLKQEPLRPRPRAPPLERLPDEPTVLREEKSGRPLHRSRLPRPFRPRAGARPRTV